MDKESNPAPCKKPLAFAPPLDFESELFKGVRYLMKDNHMLILAGHSGELGVARENWRPWIREMEEIFDVWEGVRT